MDNSDWQPRAAYMVHRQIRSRGVQDLRVLGAIEGIPRHRFVPDWNAARAYDDCPVDIGLGQTISQPYIVAYMTELLDVAPQHRVLEVGTGSGYQTAVLACLTPHLYTIEIHEELAREAQTRLESLGFRNIRYSIRNGHLGWPEFAPFDRIIVTAGAASIPPPLIEQLAPDGRLIIPVGPALEDQVLKLVIKTNLNDIAVEDKVPVRFVPLIETN